MQSPKEPERPVTILPDIHGDHMAFRLSLFRAGAITSITGDIQVSNNEEIACTGDLIDRGPDTPKIFDDLLAIAQQTRLQIALGNHELMALDAITHPYRAHIWATWLKNGGIKTMTSFGDRYGLKQAEPWTGRNILQKQLFADPTMRQLLEQEWEKGNMSYYPLDTLVQLVQRIWLQEQYKPLFQRMHLMIQVRSSVLGVHAGLNKEIAALGMKGTEDLLRSIHTSQNYQHLMYDSVAQDVTWRAQKSTTDRPFTVAALQELKAHGTSVVIHGHDYQKGIAVPMSDVDERVWVSQQLRVREGVAMINGDVALGMSNNQFGYVHIDEDGAITADSQLGGKKQFGHIQEDGVYVPPKKRR